MKLHPFALLLALVAAAPAAAQSGNFVYRLGDDTTSVERYVRTGSKIDVDQVGRSPRVMSRRYTYQFSNGAMSKLTVVVQAPGSPTPAQNIEAVVGADSIRVQIMAAGKPTSLSAPTQPGILILSGASPWPVIETVLNKLAKGKPDSLRVPFNYLGGPADYWLSVQRLGRDSVIVRDDRGSLYHVRVDKNGNVLGVLPITGTAKFSVTRVDKLDLDGMTQAFAAKEKAAGAMGALSPRDTINAQAGGAALWIDYSRPAKRGRTIFGQVVPYGEVWRTGANAATQFKTDKPLDFGNGTVIQPGMYTLWSLPAADGWKLIVNSETGEWGTEHKADKDLASIPMKVTSLSAPAEKFTISIDPSATGGTINLDWDTTRASATFTTKTP